MAEIPGAIQKMNDLEIAANSPVSENLFNKIGANINGMIDLFGEVGSVVLTASQVYQVPAGVNMLILTGCGGGGGGEGAGINWAGHGGGGGMIFTHQLAVVGGALYTATIGIAGAAGFGRPPNPTNPGTKGGDTTFVNQSDPTKAINWFGGLGGINAIPTASFTLTKQNAGGGIAVGVPGNDSAFAEGGALGAGGGGAGGGGAHGKGGDAGINGQAPGTSLIAAPFGGGGGGGAGGNASGDTGGGAGGAGFLIITAVLA